MKPAAASGPARRGPRLLVINLYYAPDIASTGQIAADICEGLTRRGFEVHVVAGQPCYTEGQPEVPGYDLRNGVHVHRISTGRARGRERMSTRLSGYLRFLWGAWRTSRGIVKRVHPDRVMTFHNPPFVGLLGAWVARRGSIPFTYALYDVHPDVLLATGWCRLPAPVIWMWNVLNRWILARAKSVIVLGEGMKDVLVESGRVEGHKVRIIPIWGRPELRPVDASTRVRQELGVGEKDLFLLYAGNMGIMHPLDLVLDAAAELRNASLRILFLGDGAQRAHLEGRAAREGLTNVSFMRFQPEDRFADIVAASDACLVALEDGLERLAVPSRAYTMLSAGRALVTIMAPHAEVARLCAEASCGWNVTSAAELKELLGELIGRRDEVARRGRMGRRVYDERFRRERLMEEYAAVVGA